MELSFHATTLSTLMSLRPDSEKEKQEVKKRAHQSDSDGSETDKQRPKRVYPLRNRTNSQDSTEIAPTSESRDPRSNRDSRSAQESRNVRGVKEPLDPRSSRGPRDPRSKVNNILLYLCLY